MPGTLVQIRRAPAAGRAVPWLPCGRRHAEGAARSPAGGRSRDHRRRGKPASIHSSTSAMRAACCSVPALRCPSPTSRKTTVRYDTMFDLMRDLRAMGVTSSLVGARARSARAFSPGRRDLRRALRRCGWAHSGDLRESLAFGMGAAWLAAEAARGAAVRRCRLQRRLKTD